MRNVLAIAILCLAGACNVSQVTGSLSAASSLLPVITTSLDAGCASSQALVGQAAAYPALASPLSGVAARIGKTCGKIDPASARAQAALDALNGVTAILLGSAGAMGIKLPGLAS